MRLRLPIAAGLLVACTLLARGEEPALMPATTRYAPATLPTAQSIIDRYVAVTGGAEAHAAVTSRRAIGLFALADLGIEGTMDVAVRADGHALIRIDLPGVGTIRQGVAHELVWIVHPIDGPRILAGAEADGLRRSLAIAPEISLAGYRSAAVVDVTPLNGRPAYRMDLTNDADVHEQRFYDVESGLLVKTIGSTPSTVGPLAVATFFGDYADAPPIRVPMRVRQSFSGMSPESIMKTVEHNVELPDSLFAPPPEIEALQTRATTTPTTVMTRPAN